MTALSRPFRRILGRRPQPAEQAIATVTAPVVPEQPGVAVDIAESDPLIAYLQTAPGPVDLARLELDSPAARRAARGRRRARRARSSRRAS